MTKRERAKIVKTLALVQKAHDLLVAKHYALPPERRPPASATPEINDLYSAYKILKTMEGE